MERRNMDKDKFNKAIEINECDMWMYIPSFDDILESNRDVLERIKEKGD